MNHHLKVSSIAIAKCATAVCDVGERGVCYEQYTLDGPGRAGASSSRPAAMTASDWRGLPRRQRLPVHERQTPV